MRANKGSYGKAVKTLKATRVTLHSTIEKVPEWTKIAQTIDEDTRGKLLVTIAKLQCDLVHATVSIADTIAAMGVTESLVERIGGVTPKRKKRTPRVRKHLRAKGRPRGPKPKRQRP